MSRSNKILLTIGLSQWVVLCSLWKPFNWDQLYFISQALFILSITTVLLRQLPNINTEIVFFLALNQAIDELFMTAVSFRFSEYIIFVLVVIYLLIKHKRNNDRQNRNSS